VAIALEVTMLVTQPDYLEALPLMDWPATMCVALVTAALVHLARPRRAPAWTLALALVGVAVFGLRVMTMMVYANAAPDMQRGTLIILGPIEAAAVAAVTLPLAILAVRSLRSLPAAPSPA
jgi:hypothetical protein